MSDYIHINIIIIQWLLKNLEDEIKKKIEKRARGTKKPKMTKWHKTKITEKKMPEVVKYY